jgi:hypothetical protein
MDREGHAYSGAAVLDNADDYTPEQMVAEIYPSLPLDA